MITHITTAFGVCGTLMYIHHPVATKAAAIYIIFDVWLERDYHGKTHNDCSG